ncbi:MAG: MCE family protein [Betaproteobacteria bacterium]|nr:MAG: MCE family protein [Betaproteobacteria bacterium]
METDRRYFLEGLFIIGFAVAAAFFFVWLAGTGHRDDVLYRIHFAESVSGLSKGDAVKFSGVDIGTVEAMAIDPGDARRVQVDVKLRKDAPVKTDTKATLKLKGITGVVYIELEGGDANAKTLLATTSEGEIPEIPSEKSSLTTVIDELPKVVERFAALENQTKKILSDVGQTTGKIKEDPSVLLKGPKEKSEKSLLRSR